MGRFVPAARDGEIPLDGMRLVAYGAHRILLVRLADSYRALDATCTHLGTSLAEGTVEDGELECPSHFARFDVCTGQVLAPPAPASLRIYPVTVVDGQVFVEVPDNDGANTSPSSS